MTGLYLVELVDVLRAAGLEVRENSTTAGWQQRARSSGGFPSTPLGVQMHHTASSTGPANDLAYMIDGSDDAPIGNVLLDRTGAYWPIAAGAANTAGKGGPVTLSRGTVPVDSGNTRTVAIEAANAGTGEPWPEQQVDAFLAGANAINRHLGNQPTDVFTHALGDGDGYTDRKIDPATADDVEGRWRPSSVNSSGTWSLADIRAELVARWEGTEPCPDPDPVPVPPWEEPVMLWIAKDQTPTGVVWIGDNVIRRPIYDPGVLQTFFEQHARGGPPVYSPAYASSPGPVTSAGDVPAVPDTTLEWMGAPL